MVCFSCILSRKKDRGSEAVRDEGQRLDEIGEDDQGLNEVGDEGRELEDLGMNLQSLEDVKNRGEGSRNSARTSRALRRTDGDTDLGTRGRNSKTNTKRACWGTQRRSRGT